MKTLWRRALGPALGLLLLALLQWLWGTQLPPAPSLLLLAPLWAGGRSGAAAGAAWGLAAGLLFALCGGFCGALLGFSLLGMLSGARRYDPTLLRGFVLLGGCVLYALLAALWQGAAAQGLLLAAALCGGEGLLLALLFFLGETIQRRGRGGCSAWER